MCRIGCVYICVFAKKFDVDVTIGTNGKIVVDSSDVTTSASYKVFDGDKFEAKVVADDGYVIDKVLVDGSETALSADDELSVVITADTTVAVSFKTEPPKDPEVSKKASIKALYNYGGKDNPSAVAYGTLSTTQGWTPSSYGVKVSDGTNTIVLPAVNNSNGNFAVRVFGPAIVSGSAYKFQSYAIYVNGSYEEKEVTSEEDTIKLDFDN